MSKRALRKKREFYNIGLDDDIKAILSLMRNIRETPDSIANDISALNSFINSIAEKNKLSFTKIIELIEEKHSQPMQVPLAIFSNRKLGILESLIKYLKENFSLRYVEIASLLQKDQRAVWIAYNKASRKSPDILSPDSSESVPVSAFCTDKPLQNLVLYLKNGLGMSNSEISRKLNRSPKTIWQTYKKANEK